MDPKNKGLLMDHYNEFYYELRNPKHSNINLYKFYYKLKIMFYDILDL